MRPIPASTLYQPDGSHPGQGSVDFPDARVRRLEGHRAGRVVEVCPEVQPGLLGLVANLDQVGAVLVRSGVSAMTTATGWPSCNTRSSWRTRYVS